MVIKGVRHDIARCMTALRQLNRKTPGNGPDLR
jgi:ribosomal protein L29